MFSDKKSVEIFLQEPGVLIDVRSPAEFCHSRIPGAVNIPLFSDEERKEVGICYKQQGQKEAIHLAVKLVGPKLFTFLEAIKHYPKPFRVYCWRGGMRSGFMSWFFQFTGMPSVTLDGGYKAFRRTVQSILDRPYRLHVVGGFTGSGKTEHLAALKAQGEQVIDLEAIANHRGSAFGVIGAQPTNEQFENEAAMQLASYDLDRPIWLEDESRMIGSCVVPWPLFEKMQQAPMHILQAPLEERLQRIIDLYGKEHPEALVGAVMKIKKKLGGQRTECIVSSIRTNQLKDAVVLLLEYYDRAYSFSIHRRKSLHISEHTK